MAIMIRLRSCLLLIAIVLSSFSMNLTVLHAKGLKSCMFDHFTVWSKVTLRSDKYVNKEGFAETVRENWVSNRALSTERLKTIKELLPVIPDEFAKYQSVNFNVEGIFGRPDTVGFELVSVHQGLYGGRRLKIRAPFFFSDPIGLKISEQGDRVADLRYVIDTLGAENAFKAGFHIDPAEPDVIYVPDADEYNGFVHAWNQLLPESLKIRVQMAAEGKVASEDSAFNRNFYQNFQKPLSMVGRQYLHDLLHNLEGITTHNEVLGSIQHQGKILYEDFLPWLAQQRDFEVGRVLYMSIAAEVDAFFARLIDGLNEAYVSAIPNELRAIYSSDALTRATPEFMLRYQQHAFNMDFDLESSFERFEPQANALRFTTVEGGMFTEKFNARVGFAYASPINFWTGIFKQSFYKDGKLSSFTREEQQVVLNGLKMFFANFPEDLRNLNVIRDHQLLRSIRLRSGMTREEWLRRVGEVPMMSPMVQRISILDKLAI